MKKFLRWLLSLGILLLAVVYRLLTADPSGSAVHVMTEVNSGLTADVIDDQYRTTYEVFLYSFCDSNNDGIGDINGLISRLDYIQDLGFNQIWLMPVMPSDTYHKYDVKDYRAIDPAYGTMDDYDRLIEICHSRGIRVIIDLVLNHTASGHPWFQEAAAYLRGLNGREANVNECPYVDYYHFRKDFQNGYAKLADSDYYYEARFWDGMPDLNLDNGRVRDEIRDIMSFWIGHGTDGFRLDAVTSYYTGDPGRNIEFLRWLKQAGTELKQDCYFVCEAWTGMDEYASYYASGIDSMFDFAFGDSDGVIARTLKGIYTAREYGNTLEREWQMFAGYSDTYINAPFYTNHDMGRGAGYYAGDDGSKTKMALSMNLMTTGNVFVYYGEELGMKGSGKDENKRAPMYWSEDRNAQGMTQGPPYMEDFEMKFPSYEVQKDDPYSIYNYVKEAIRIRNALPVIARGRTWLHQDLTTDQVCVLLKEDGVHAPAAVIMNISDSEQTVDVTNTEFHTLRGILAVNDTPVMFENNVLTLPPYSTAVLTE